MKLPPTAQNFSSPASPSHWVAHLAWVLVLVEVWIFVLPHIPLKWSDDLGLFSAKSLAQMVTGLTFVQALGGFLGSTLGRRAGTVMTGLLGGFVSSTAVTATAARNSRKSAKDLDTHVLLFACSILAMLLEGVAIVSIGFPSAALPIYSVFLGPVLVALFFAYQRAQKVKVEIHPSPTTPDFLAIGRVTLFLIVIIALSRLARNFFGKSGLIAFTLLASFFEIHATLISNTALRNSDGVETSFFIGLIAISLCASYISKLFIARSLGSAEMFRIVWRWSALALASLAASLIFALSLDALL